MQAGAMRSSAFRAVGIHHSQRSWRPLANHARLFCRAAPLVYVATLPLVGWETVEEILKDKYPDELALHCMVLIESEETVTMFDFLPELPTSPFVAAALLSGRQAKGIVRERRLSRLPVRRCWLVGPSATSQALQEARSFNSSFDDRIQLLRNDCRSHSVALVKHLTGLNIKVSINGISGSS
ncbi:hypothetical protein ABBQ38_011556 [Trebouxia sp. C0009 RCD-2024]